MSRTRHHHRQHRPKGLTAESNRVFRTNAKRALRGEPMHHARGYRDRVDFDVCTRASDVRRIASLAEWEGWKTWPDDQDLTAELRLP